MLQTRTRTGQAYRDGRLIAAELELGERGEQRFRTIDVPGSSRRVRRPGRSSYEAHVRFMAVDDEQLREELAELIASAEDDDRRREQRDRGWAPEPIDLVLEYEDSRSGCRLHYPSFGFSAIEITDFPIKLGPKQP